MPTTYCIKAALTVACFFLAEVTSTQHVHEVVKRSDDPTPLQAVVDHLSQTVTQLQARLTVLETANSKQVAFLAQSNAATVKANAAIPFSPAFNIGNGYSSRLNEFTAPFPGTYLLTFQLFCQQTGDELMDLMQNNNIIVRLRVYDPQYTTSEASAILVQAAAGDRFWIRSNVDTTLYTGVHSFFSGALIIPQ